MRHPVFSPESAVVPAEGDPRPGRATVSAAGEGQPAALILGGDAQAREGLKARVTAQGYNCGVVADVPEAIAECTRRPYDAVVADLASLGGAPATVLQALHGAPGEPAVIAMTRAEDAAHAQAAYDAGVMGLLRQSPLDAELRFTLRSAVETRRRAQERKALARRIQTEVLKQTKELLDTITRLERVQAGVRRSQEETIYRLSRASEYRDNETGQHLQRMSQYSAILARNYGMSNDRAETIRVASPMHDVGKIGISVLILYKKGRHTAEEFEIMKQHAQIGYEILRGSQSELLETAAIIAWTHHEKYDGSGYPRGLRGAEIPLEGRIVAIADVFDALTSKRVYKPAFSLEQATQMMTEGQGKHFDPGLLDLFWDSLNEVLEVRARYTDPEHEGQPASA
jgi:putative two-component system response regulator